MTWPFKTNQRVWNVIQVISSSDRSRTKEPGKSFAS
jgi:hypothetical protein